MSETIEALRVPVTILGVGAQLRLDGKIERLDAMKESGLALRPRGARAVAVDRCARRVHRDATSRASGSRTSRSSAARRSSSHGPELTVRKRVAALTADSRVSLNLSPYVPGLGPIVERHMARYPNLRYAAQHRDALGMLLSRKHRSKTHGDRPGGPADAPRPPAGARRPHELLRRPRAVDALPRGLRLQLRHPHPRQHRRAARRHARDGAGARLPHARARRATTTSRTAR